MKGDIEMANEFANLTFIYGGKIAFTSEQMKGYQKSVKSIIQRNEQLEKYYQCERNLLDSYIPKERVREAIEVINKQIDEAIDGSKGGLDGDFIKKGSELLAQKRILQSLLLVKEKENG